MLILLEHQGAHFLDVWCFETSSLTDVLEHFPVLLRAFQLEPFDQDLVLQLRLLEIRDLLLEETVLGGDSVHAMGKLQQVALKVLVEFFQLVELAQLCRNLLQLLGDGLLVDLRLAGFSRLAVHRSSARHPNLKLAAEDVAKNGDVFVLVEPVSFNPHLSRSVDDLRRPEI